MTVRFGVTLPQFTSDRDRFESGVTTALEAGFDSLWVFDHIWPLGAPGRPILECWTTLAWLAARTEAHVGTLVTRSSLRNPTVLAKMALTAGVIAPERVTLAIGSGDRMNRNENLSIGADYLEGAARVRQLVETVERVKQVFLDPEMGRRGGPPAIWVGGRSVELLEVAGRVADGWNGWGSNLEGFAQDAAKVRDLAAGRRFDITWAGQVVLGDTDSDARRRLGDRDPVQHLFGTPETVAERLATAVEAGATHLIASVPSITAEDYEALATLRTHLRG